MCILSFIRKMWPLTFWHEVETYAFIIIYMFYTQVYIDFLVTRNNRLEFFLGCSSGLSISRENLRTTETTPIRRENGNLIMGMEGLKCKRSKKLTEDEAKYKSWKQSGKAVKNHQLHTALTSIRMHVHIRSCWITPCTQYTIRNNQLKNTGLYFPPPLLLIRQTFDPFHAFFIGPAYPLNYFLGQRKSLYYSTWAHLVQTK